jgi:hypothetical protein
MKKIIDAIPRFLLGPLAVIIGIFYFVQSDPPKTICDTQFEIFKEEKDIKKYIYSYKSKSVEISAEIKRDIERCQNTNSPGGCFDWMEGLKRVLHVSRNLPAKCRDRMDELKPYQGWLTQSLFVFSQISWNNSTIVRKGLHNWLEDDDILLFCRLKSEYIRLFGAEAYKKQEMALLQLLQKEKKMPAQQAWPRTVLSYRCPILN